MDKFLLVSEETGETNIEKKQTKKKGYLSTFAPSF